MVERTGEAFEFDEQLTVVGRQLQVGDRSPDFAADYFDAIDEKMEVVRLSDSAGSVRVLNVINSIDTPVCHVETLRWDRVPWPENVQLYTLTMDLPFALARWQTAEDTKHKALSTHRSTQFGIDYGVLLKEWRMLQRAVFVIDGNETIIHAEYVADQMQEPDYDAAIAAARQEVQ